MDERPVPVLELRNRGILSVLMSIRNCLSDKNFRLSLTRGSVPALTISESSCES
ncbi:MAG: hypothetical protein NHB15_01925 [Methanosarcina barkeri]|nr:hypothetical protein [Methanosarcina sp. ERenArc_MAG2]